MKKSSFCCTAAGFSALLFMVALGGCAPSTPSDAPASAGATTAKGAPQSPPPNINIGNEKAMNDAAQESAAKFAKQKK